MPSIDGVRLEKSVRVSSPPNLAVLKNPYPGFEIEGEVGLTPVNSVNVSGNDAKQLLLLLEKLEDHEDIQKVYSNFDLDESEIGSLL